MTADLTVHLGDLELPNPITTASGCFASGQEIDRFYDVNRLGAVVVKSITREPRAGLPTPRMAETPSGMLNAIGLQNPGVDGWVANDLPWLVRKGVRVIASIAGKTVDDYRHVARALQSQLRYRGPGRGGLIALEVNISCPNVEDRGIVFACKPDPSAAVISAVREETDLPLFAKLTPDVTDVTEIARAVHGAGATGVSLINTLLGMAVDAETGRPKIANVMGGLSGPAVRPVAVRNVWQVHKALPDLPIIAMGGVRTVEDVIEFIRVGATMVAVGTSNFVDPFAANDLVDGLQAWLDAREIATVRELRGRTTT